MIFFSACSQLIVYIYHQFLEKTIDQYTGMCERGLISLAFEYTESLDAAPRRNIRTGREDDFVPLLFLSGSHEGYK